MTQIDVFCGTCGATGSVDRVTAGLQCRCGSTDVGLMGLDERPEDRDRMMLDPELTAAPTPRVASIGGVTAAEETKTTCPNCGSKDADEYHWTQNGKGMVSRNCPDCGDAATVRVSAYDAGGTGWNKPHPDPLQGWNDYVGPSPSPNPQAGQQLDVDQMVCPVCNGRGFDVNDNAICRECGGSGRVTATTSKPAVESLDVHPGPPVGGARWASVVDVNTTLSPSTNVIVTFPSGQTGTAVLTMPNAPTIASQGQRQDRDWNAPVALDGVGCPECKITKTTQLKLDGRGHGWWVCANCGPLADIDAHPEVDPYTRENYSGPDRSMKVRAGWLPRRQPKPGRLYTIMASIAETNDGISDGQVFDLARRTVELQDKA